jgi:hypothetical protein
VRTVRSAIDYFLGNRLLGLLIKIGEVSAEKSLLGKRMQGDILDSRICREFLTNLLIAKNRGRGEGW